MGLCAPRVTLPVTIKAVYDSSSLVYTDSCLYTVQASCVGQGWCGPHRAGREEAKALRVRPPAQSHRGREDWAWQPSLSWANYPLPTPPPQRTAHLPALWSSGFPQAVSARAPLVLLPVTLCSRDHMPARPSLPWPQEPGREAPVKTGTPKGPALPCLQASFFEAGKDLRNHICQGSGRKQMALSSWVIWGEFNKGPIYRGAGRV